MGEPDTKRPNLAEYLLEFDFDNIKNLWISKSKPKEENKSYQEKKR